MEAAAPSNLPLLGGLGLFAVLLALFNFGTRAGTIARATWKESLRQPVFAIMTVIGMLVIVANYVVPFFAMGDETKMFIDCGMSTILICCSSSPSGLPASPSPRKSKAKRR